MPSPETFRTVECVSLKIKTLKRHYPDEHHRTRAQEHGHCFHQHGTVVKHVLFVILLAWCCWLVECNAPEKIYRLYRIFVPCVMVKMCSFGYVTQKNERPCATCRNEWAFVPYTVCAMWTGVKFFLMDLRSLDDILFVPLPPTRRVVLG